MIIVFLVIFVAAFLGFCVLGNKSCEWQDFGFGAATVAALLFVAGVVAAFVLAIQVGTASVIDERIQMYTEENAKIEEQIAAVVSQYQGYEHDIFTEVAPDSSVALVALYPDLKSDILVQSQIEIYLNNNEKIKQLKDEAILVSVYRWWLYFGK